MNLKEEFEDVLKLELKEYQTSISICSDNIKTKMSINDVIVKGNGKYNKEYIMHKKKDIKNELIQISIESEKLNIKIEPLKITINQSFINK